MIIEMTELGYHQRKVLALDPALQQIEPRIFQVKPDLVIKPLAEQQGEDLSPFVGLLMPKVAQALVGRPDLIITPLPDADPPQIMIMDPNKDRQYHEHLRRALNPLVKRRVVSGIHYHKNLLHLLGYA